MTAGAPRIVMLHDANVNAKAIPNKQTTNLSYKSGAPQGPLTSRHPQH